MSGRPRWSARGGAGPVVGLVGTAIVLAAVGASVLDKVPTNLVRASVFPGSGEPAGMRFPYGRATKIHHDVRDLTAAWREWKERHVARGGKDRLRVLGGVDDVSTVSEGQAYGMLFAAIFDEPDTFASLWRFAQDHLNEHGLMRWHIGASGEVIGSGAATDADEDMAMALVYACLKQRAKVWPRLGDPCRDATALIDRILAHEVVGKDDDGPGTGGEVLPGDWRDDVRFPRGLFNPSYFTPGYYRAFGRFTGRVAEWDAVIARGYHIIDLAQRSRGNCSGLVANWTTFEGEPQAVHWQPRDAAYFAWDAARLPWRLAVDHAWHGSRQAAGPLNLLAGFLGGVGVDRLRAVYRLDGTALLDERWPFFLSAAAAALWAAPAPSVPVCGESRGELRSSAQEAYDALLASRSLIENEGSYYNLAWRLLTMLLLTGNFPDDRWLVAGDMRAP